MLTFVPLRPLFSKLMLYPRVSVAYQHPFDGPLQLLHTEHGHSFSHHLKFLFICPDWHTRYTLVSCVVSAARHVTHNIAPQFRVERKQLIYSSSPERSA